MEHQILVPLDGSPIAERALPYAQALAEAVEARPLFVHVENPLPPLPGSGWYPSPPVEECRGLLVEAAARVGKASGREPDVEILAGRVDDAIVERSGREGVALVVMTTHGRGPLARLWLGGVADAVARRAPVPVLLVPPDVDGAPATARPLPSLRHVLVPLDGSKLAEEALERVESLVRPLSPTFTLVRVVADWPEGVPVDLPGLFDQRPSGIERLREEARSELQAVADRFRSRGWEIAEEVVSDAHAATGILRAASMVGADVIAMTTHGHGGVRRFVLGSVADQVVRSADVPVLLLRPAKEAAIASAASAV